MGQLTFTILKPDAVAAGHTGKIIDHILNAGFEILAMKLIHQTPTMAGKFYEIHKERPFYNDLVKYMSSAPCIPMVLRKKGSADAVTEFRTLIGATDPSKAAEGTIRKLYATSIEANAVHGSDSDENAAREARFYFAEIEEVA